MNNSLEKTKSYDYVEIGGLKWATKNIGAETETDTGLYFQWGDTQGYTADEVGKTEGKKTFSWVDYKFNPSGDGKTLTKYNGDNKTELDPEDDAVHAIIGGDWRMPTKAEWQLLIDNTTSQWVENYNDSDVNGMLFTDKTDSSKKLFFPASGYYHDGSFYDIGDYGDVWCCSLHNGSVYGAWSLDFGNGGVSVGGDGRCIGLVVRGVMNSNNKLENFETPSDEKVLERWEKLGLTYGIKNEELKLKLSWAYENMAKTLVLEEIEDSEDTVLKMECRQWLAMVIFPIIRKTVVEYYEKYNEIKTIDTNDYFEFFKNHTLSDIINTELCFENMDVIIEIKKIFNKIFEVINENTKLIDFNFHEIDMNDINERLEKENPENANHPEDKYNERRYSSITIDIEAVFVAMIAGIIIKEVFEK